MTENRGSPMHLHALIRLGRPPRPGRLCNLSKNGRQHEIKQGYEELTQGAVKSAAWPVHGTIGSAGPYLRLIHRPRSSETPSGPVEINTSD